MTQKIEILKAWDVS